MCQTMFQVFQAYISSYNIVWYVQKVKIIVLK